MCKFIDLTGQKFGRLTVLEKSERKGMQIYWKCVCDCGTKVVVMGNSLKRGKTQSCGCLNRQKRHERNFTHGLTHTRQYHSWADMKRRCNNPSDRNYHHYGGRGIAYDPKWETFKGFWEDMKEGYWDNLTLERINVNGNYCKSNCKWITQQEQLNNMRSNVILEISGEKHNIAQWARLTGINSGTIRSRIRYGKVGLELIAPVARKEAPTP